MRRAVGAWSLPLVCTILTGGGLESINSARADGLGDDLLAALSSADGWWTGAVDVTAVDVAPDPFSPAVTDGRADSTVVSTTGSAALPNNKKKVEHAVASYVVVSQGGTDVRTLVALVPIAFPPGSRPGTRIDVAAGEEWDGRDEDGEVVLDGTYDVRVIHALLGRKTSGTTAPWPTGDALVTGLLDTLSAGGPSSGGDGAPWVRLRP